MSDWVRDLLAKFADRVALRVATSPGATSVQAFSGIETIARATRIAGEQAIVGERRIVLLLMPHCPELFLMHLGLILLGHVPAILAWPTTRVDPEKYQRNLIHQLNRIPADQLITLPRLADNLRGLLGYPVSSCDTANAAQFESAFRERFVTSAAPVARAHAPALPPDTLFLQFSGGTTGAQKCVPVTLPMLESQLRRLTASLAITEHDGVVSWLPLYHDMGLIACLWLPAYAGAASLHFAASDWLMRPELLLHFLESEQATFTWLPNFAFSYLAQRCGAIDRSFGLAHVRAWINCSEPVRSASVKAFIEAFSQFGVSAGSLQASYAMAENVFAVTQTDMGASVREIPRTVVRHAAVKARLQSDELLDQVYVSSGRCLPETSVRIVRGDGLPSRELEPGEIQISSPSLFDGYWGADGKDISATRGTGWYSTGDYGFFDRGELFVIGRLKDVIIVGGQNVFPEDLETIAASVPGVQPGRVVAFGLDDAVLGTQSIVVVAEAVEKADQQGAVAIERGIRSLISASLGVAARHVRVVPARWIVKSTAGKISRTDTRARFLAEMTKPIVPASAALGSPT